MNYPDFKPKEREALIKLLDRQGKGMTSAIRTLIERGETYHTILTITKQTQAFERYSLHQIYIMIIALDKHGHTDFISELQKGATTSKLSLQEVPNTCSNIYDWFVDTHSNQIAKLLANGVTQRNLVRQFNEAHSPGSKPDRGLQAISLRIHKRKLLPKKTECWFSQHPKVVRKLKRGRSPAKVYPSALAEGFDGSLRTFQRMAQKVIS